MRIRRSLSLVLILILCFTTFTFAQSEKTEIVINEFKEITDTNILFDRALKGIDESKGKLKNNSTAEITNKVTNEKIQLQTASTTQLLKETKVGNQIVRSYATTAAAYSKTDSGNSEGGADVKATSTIYWEEYDINNVPVANMTGANGNWKIMQSGVVLSNLFTHALQQGFVYGGAYEDQPGDWVPESTSFNLKYKFKPVEQDVIVALLGLTMKCDWKRGSSGPYEFKFSNAQVFDNY